MKHLAATFVQTAVSGALALLTLPNPVQAQTCAAGIRASNPSSVYIVDAANGTVTDTRTALMWDRCPRGLTGATCAGGTIGAFSWPLALDTAAAANSASYKGYGDWRLPNLKELRSLVEECRLNPGINEWAFPGTPSSGFWSGSPRASVTSVAWGVFFDVGDAYTNGRSSALWVRLVRAGQ
jgi:Protein of unknown function (DUF1566)